VSRGRWREAIDVRIAFFHVRLGLADDGEAKLRVEPMGVAGHEMLATEMLQTWMRREVSERGFREAAAAMRLEHVNVAEVGEGGGVGDDADEADLGAVGRIDAEREGVCERAGNGLAGDAGGPVGGRQVGVDSVDVEAGGDVGEVIAGVRGFVRHGA